MAEQPQTIVEASKPASKPYGTRSESSLISSFPESPIYKGEITDDERKSTMQSSLDGTVKNGLGLNSFDLDYSEAPDFEDVATGGGGLPASPYMPNPTSPGVGSVFPNDQAEFTGDIPDPGVEYGTGLGGMTSPSTTSTNISAQTLGDYLKGKSYQGSNGIE